MDEILIYALAMMNIVFLSFGYCFVAKRCDDASKEIKNYRSMTDLEIRLLNKKIENRNELDSMR